MFWYRVWSPKSLLQLYLKDIYGLMSLFSQTVLNSGSYDFVIRGHHIESGACFVVSECIFPLFVNKQEIQLDIYAVWIIKCH